MAGTDDQKNEFIVQSFVGSFSFLATFGFAKAVANLLVYIKMFLIDILHNIYKNNFYFYHF